MTDADKQLGISICERWPVDLADVQGIIEFVRSRVSAEHDWRPDGGVLRFESHPGGEAPHVHTTCSKCGERAWFPEHQWGLLTKGCSVDQSESAATVAPYSCVSDMLRDALRYACIRDRLAIEDVDRVFEDCPMGSTNINPEESKATDEAIDKYMEGYRG